MPNTAIMESDTLKGDRAFDRDLARHIPSRGERRKLRAKREQARMWAKREKRIRRAFERVRAWAIFEQAHKGASWRHPIVLRSWKEASRVSNPGGDLWLRSRVNLKTFGSKRQRTAGGQLDANASRLIDVLNGAQLKVTDEKSTKIRYISPGLAKKIMAGGQGTMADEDTSVEQG